MDVNTADRMLAWIENALDSDPNENNHPNAAKYGEAFGKIMQRFFTAAVDKPGEPKLVRWIREDLREDTAAAGYRAPVIGDKYSAWFETFYEDTPHLILARLRDMLGDRHHQCALLRALERRQWGAAARALREKYGARGVSVRGSVLNALYLVYRPPAHLLVDYMLSERNATHWLMCNLLEDYHVERDPRAYGYENARVDVDGMYTMHAALRYFRPTDLVLEPKLRHYEKSSKYAFELAVTKGDRNMRTDRRQVYFSLTPWYTYSLLTQAGFRAKPLEIIRDSFEPGVNSRSVQLIPDEHSLMSEHMKTCCEEYDNNCSSLESICRNVIRSNIVSLDVRAFQKLVLPEKLKKSLCLESVDCPVFRRFTGKPFPKHADSEEADSQWLTGWLTGCNLM